MVCVFSLKGRAKVRALGSRKLSHNPPAASATLSSVPRWWPGNLHRKSSLHSWTSWLLWVSETEFDSFFLNICFLWLQGWGLVFLFFFFIALVTWTSTMLFGPLTEGLASCGAGFERGEWVGGEWWAAGPQTLGFGSCSIWGRLQITAPISHWIWDWRGTDSPCLP